MFGIAHFGLLALSMTLLAANVARADEFTVKGLKIHYQVAGDGPPVMLIHGLYASADINWKLPGTISELARDHRVVAIDLPGHGRSDKPADEAAYGVQLVDDVALLLDHLKIEHAHIVGYSMGGMVTAKFLVLYPQRALSGTVSGMGWLQPGSALEKHWDRLPSREGPGTPTEFLRAMSKLAVSEAELRGIKTPVKVIVGGRDPIKEPFVDPLRTVRPDWPVVTISGAGHLDCIFNRQFRTEIATWLRSQK